MNPPQPVRSRYRIRRNFALHVIQMSFRSSMKLDLINQSIRSNLCLASFLKRKNRSLSNIPSLAKFYSEAEFPDDRRGKGNCRRAAIFQARSNEPASNRRGNDRDNKWNPLIGQRFIIPLAPHQGNQAHVVASVPAIRSSAKLAVQRTNKRTNEQPNKQRLSSLVLAPPPLLPLSPHRSTGGGRACTWRRRFRQHSTLHSTLTKL